ncbi:ABC transporter substrate-binding protein [soil metagenome]
MSKKFFFLLYALLWLTSIDVQAIQRGGQITAATDIEPVSLDPIMGNGFNSDPNVYNLIYDKLITLDSKGNPTSQLAESWSLASDLKSLTMKLRKGVLFHDGTPFDALAAKFNLDRVAAPGSKAPASGFVSDIESVVVVDPETIRIHFKTRSGPIINTLGRPSVPILAALAIQSGMMVSPTAVKTYGERFGRTPVGTGPFKFVEWIAGEKIVVTNNPNYWKIAADSKPLPYLDRVTVRFLETSQSKRELLQNGSVQLVDSLSAREWERVRSDKSLELLSRPQISNSFLSFNVTKPPFDNKNLRRAVAHALNRQRIESLITKGFGQVNATLWGPLDWIYDSSIKAPELSVQKAAALYRSSGHKGPLTLTVIQRDPDTQVARLIQEQLKAAGIEVKVNILERTPAMASVNGKQYEMALLRGPSPAPDPDITFSAFYGRNAKQNFSGQTDERLFSAVDRARSVFMKDLRIRHYSDAQQILMDESYYVYIFASPIFEARRRELNGLKRESVGQWLLTEAWLSK